MVFSDGGGGGGDGGDGQLDGPPTDAALAGEALRHYNWLVLYLLSYLQDATNSVSVG